MISQDLSNLMNANMNCPSCGEPVSPDHRYCEHCGVDLAIAALLAEQQAMLPIRIPQGMPMSPELLVPRIGDYLIERGLLKTSQLQTALAFQRQRANEGKPLLLGQALLELGMITRETLDQVITAQILQLQYTLNEANQSLKQRVEDRTRELRQALERLSELNQLKSNFIANISHELRTPLTHIKGYLDILSDGGLGSLNKEQQDAINVLKKAENRLERLIEDLIQFSLASRGDLSLNLRELETIQVVKTAVERSRNKARQQEIELIIDIPANLPSINADEDKIGWVLLQLLDNALKFTPKGGQVAIHARHNHAGLMNFVIRDSGIGIPDERISEIFEPFHQLDSSATRRYQGTGLGLAMVRRIIEAHGSQIKVKSVVGKGSQFEFDLPVSENIKQTKERAIEP
jgi:signal transduction histidine kinase